MVKNQPADAGDMDSIPTPEFLLGKSHGQRSLVGYSHKELDMTEVT